MEYNYEFLRKCHGLRFRATLCNKKEEGIIKVEEDGILLCYGAKDPGRLFIFERAKTLSFSEQSFGILPNDFEIVPRAPETYQDWQVGDIACEEEHRNARYEVIFRSGELVFFKDWNNYATTSFTCSEAFRRFGFRLVLTDIEKQIIEDGKKTELATARTLWGKPFDGTGKIWKPQDGDICFVETDTRTQKFIIIYKDNSYSLADLDGSGWKLKGGSLWAYSHIRPASEEEKQELFDAMAKKGKRWNAEKKVVEDIPDLRAVKSEVKSEIKSGHQFKKGEPVLVRDHERNRWRIAAYSGEDSVSFLADTGKSVVHWKYCIPYNERTMHLLGTTEDYKEEQS